MLIIGAKGFSREVLEIFHQLDQLQNIGFYDDVNMDIGTILYDRFPVLKNEEGVKEFFIENGNEFTLGIGNPILRFKLYNKFMNFGGKFYSTISPLAQIGHYGNKLGEGCNIMTNTVITNEIKIGKGVLINLSCTVGHGTIIEDFVELCPGVNISGNCVLGKCTFIGTNATVLPNVRIGENVTIGAGSVVTKDIPDNCLAFGIPAKVIKNLEPLKF